MALTGFYDAFWEESFWFPANRSHGWKDLVNKPGSDMYLPDIKHLNWAFLLGIVLIGVRYLLETLIVVPIAVRMGVSNKGKPSVTPNETLEKAYKEKKTLKSEAVKGLAKQTDMSERQVEIWFRKRKKMDMLTPMQKFRECSWHLVFYTAFFVYGMIYLWQKPYFWKTIECWRNWPVQDVTSDMYWHYLLELGFYWSLVFTLFSDNKRKDFKEMIIHHFATMVLMYFSWLLNFVRVGTLVLVVHDAADTWLALAKMSIYAKNKLATDIFFGIFLVVWVISRLFVYPFVVLYCTTVEPYTIKLMDTTFGAQWFFNFFLYLLLVLHFIWTYLIFRIVYRKMMKGNVEDVRSDSEDSDDEMEGEDDNDVDEHSKNNDVINGYRKPVNGLNGGPRG
ncbi:Ceramide synthase 5 [Mactra antiquata]